MKTCTRMRIVASHVDDMGVRVVDEAEVLDIGLVDDDHAFGADPQDVLVLHVEGAGMISEEEFKRRMEPLRAAGVTVAEAARNIAANWPPSPSARAVTEPGRVIPVREFTADDLAKIQGAYDVLQRVGNDTAIGGAWNEYIDRAHQDLGLILAVHAAAAGLA